MTITAEVYDGASPATLIATLTASFQRGWLDQLNDVGSGMCSIHVTDADLAAHPTLKHYGNIVRLILDGTPRFAFVIEQRSCPPAPVGEDHDRIWTFTGRGVLALLEDAVVYPEGPVVGSMERQRLFDFTAIAYNDSTWIAATQIQQQGSTSADERRWYHHPAGWPDPLAYWIWSRAKDAPWPAGKMPVGTSYFRKTFTLVAAKDVKIFATCDNQFELWLNGEPLLQGNDWTTVYTVQRTLGAGTYELAVIGTNVGISAASAAAPGGPAGLLVSVIEIDEVGALTTTVIVRTDSSWKCLDYPTSVPGMTVGEILRILITEAQTRGALVGVTRNFTDTVDARSAAWTQTPDIAFDIGTHYTDVIRTLVEQLIDVRMSPTLVLSVYNKGTLGSDLTGSVSLTVGVDFEELANAGDGHLTNTILGRIASGELSEHLEAISLAARKRRETYIEIATAPSLGQAQRVAVALFTDFAAPSAQTQGKVIASSGPYTAWAPGDMIKLPNAAGAATNTNVLSIGISEDPETGRAVFAIVGAQDDA